MSQSPPKRLFGKTPRHRSSDFDRYVSRLKSRRGLTKAQATAAVVSFIVAGPK